MQLKPIETIEDLEQVQKAVDEAYKAEVYYEINLMLQQRFVDWGRTRPGAFFVAVYSVANGAFDDLKRDVMRQRITIDDAGEILDKMLEFGLINQSLHSWHAQKIAEAWQCQSA